MNYWIHRDGSIWLGLRQVAVLISLLIVAGVSFGGGVPVSIGIGIAEHANQDGVTYDVSDYGEVLVLWGDDASFLLLYAPEGGPVEVLVSVPADALSPAMAQCLELCIATCGPGNICRLRIAKEQCECWCRDANGECPSPEPEPEPNGAEVAR